MSSKRGTATAVTVRAHRTAAVELREVGVA
jgi:hypothetical protein